jgi:hypothetical protein
MTNQNWEPLIENEVIPGWQTAAVDSEKAQEKIRAEMYWSGNRDLLQKWQDGGEKVALVQPQA